MTVLPKNHEELSVKHVDIILSGTSAPSAVPYRPLEALHHV
jgi:hypothetical protein